MNSIASEKSKISCGGLGKQDGLTRQVMKMQIEHSLTN